MNKVLSTKQFTTKYIESLILTAILMIENPNKFNNVLKNKIMVNLFFEPSTRTSVSFQTAMIKFTSIQWNMQAFVFALGAGVTASVDSGANNYGGVDCALTFAFGGDPINKTVAIHVKHAAAVSSNTISIYGWKCQSEAGFTIPFNTDEAAFEYSFNCIRADTNWAGQTLAREEQLMAVSRQLTGKQSTAFSDDGGPGKVVP